MHHLRESLKFVHDHHDQIAEAVHKLTSEQQTEIGDVAAGRKEVGAVTANPLVDLLLSLLTDPTKLQGILALIMSIISLFKKP